MRGVFGRCLDQAFANLLKLINWLINNNPKNYIKIIVSFFQVAGSLFLKMDTEWPQSLGKIWRAFAFLTVEIYKLPGYDCVFGDYDTLQKLQITTTAPMALLILASFPLLVSQGLGYRRSRRKALLDNFWNFLLWLCYLTYPFLCVTCLQNYPCLEVEGEVFFSIKISPTLVFCEHHPM